MYIINILKKIIIKTKTIKTIQTDKEECIIFGSGPSLDRLDISSPFLEGKDLIGCNFIHQHKSLMNKKFKFFSMIDRGYTEQVNQSYFEGVECDQFLISTKNAYLFKLTDLMRKKISVIKTKEFEINSPVDKRPIIFGSELLTGNSLPFLIQCAAFLGRYKTIYLYGVDHFSFDDLQGDENHNYDDYQGRKIKDLKMTREKLEYINSLYLFVKGICEQEGIKVINVTPHSKLDMFDKIVITELLNSN